MLLLQLLLTWLRRIVPHEFPMDLGLADAGASPFGVVALDAFQRVRLRLSAVVVVVVVAAAAAVGVGACIGRPEDDGKSSFGNFAPDPHSNSGIQCEDRTERI